MADEAQRNSGGAARGWGKAIRSRLYARLLLLLAIGLVFMTLAGLQLVDPWIDILVFAVVLVLAAIIPDTTEAPASLATTARASDPPFADGLRLLADALPDPAIVLDRRSIVFHLNAAARRQFPAVVVDSPLAFTLRAPSVLGAIETVRRTGAPETIELHQFIPTESWHRVTVAPLPPGEPATEGVLVITMHDLTEARRLETLRSDFIANASHELRTPLASLVGFIDTLLGPAANDPEARQRFLGIMRSQAGRMSKLIEDLLSLSRIEMRQHVRPTEPVELGALVREVAEALGPLAAESGPRLVLGLPEEPLTVSGDRDELYEVVENLIENAIKYGGEGGDIEIALAPATARAGFAAVLTVTDHGPGVAAEHVPRLTERFYRVDAESSRRKKGTGLGLAIVKHIVARHHGQLAITSAPGQGTRVEVLLRP